MYLKSVTLKGFKSFPARTKLDFGPGVSVIVGPNGSGKSNIADAIVWALGEQSAGAIRGQSMQDFLYGGAAGIASSSYAEVELVFDNSDGRLDSDFSELSITRKLSRDGDGEYRLNGARCRLIDVIEVLSDTGLGKEMHSVLSQGKVDHVVGSKPKDRRMLIEEAAGLGKHRKRRRRAQLKLEKTRDNLDRLLDVEREARTRLKPLKRQAEAAETHARLEYQANELKALLLSDRLLDASSELSDARATAQSARQARGVIDEQLAQVAREREVAEREISAQAAERERVATALFNVRSSLERIEMRRDQVAERARAFEAEIERCKGELSQLELDVSPELDGTRLAQIELELAEVQQREADQLDVELGEMNAKLTAARGELEGLDAAHGAARKAVEDAEQAASAQRSAARDQRTSLDQARRKRASLEGELTGVEQFLRNSSTRRGEDALADHVQVEPGYERALAAVLGYRLGSTVVGTLDAANTLLDARGDDGGSVLVATAAKSHENRPAPAGAQPLRDKLTVAAGAEGVVSTLLGDVWLVENFSGLPADFAGIAVTQAGRVWFGATGEVRQTAGGGEQRELTARNKQQALVVEIEQARADEAGANAALEQSHLTVATADGVLEQAHEAARSARHARDEAASAIAALERAIERYRQHGANEGPLAVKRAALEAEMRSERSHAESAARAADLQRRRREQLSEQLQLATSKLPNARELANVLADGAAVAGSQVAAFTASVERERAMAKDVTQQLRELATREAGFQTALREAGELVTGSEVRAQRAQDLHNEVAAEIRELASALGSAIEATAALLPAAEREEAEAKLARIARRRELLGPINPLAKDEYAEAVAHVEELEAQRNDLETALKELGDLTREIDRTIRTSFEDTFASTSAHFSELVARLFPGGTGELRLVREEMPSRPVLTAPEAATDEDASGEAEAAEPDELPEDPETGFNPDNDFGVEIEVKLPGSKTGRRLSLLSGGERSLVALAFMFSIFLTRPCPFYVFDEAEAALDDINIDRLVSLLREHSEQSQFIVITHQKRTMDAADQLYGVSMGADGITKVITRKLRRDGDESSSQDELEPVAA
ncbi:MAG: AAA family ATPase [Thermoleophilaceae bacterium]|nr:AAA family ATPase [Thermoleophilaceae bacterium]